MNTHRAIVIKADMETILVAGGTKVPCYEHLKEWLAEHPLQEGDEAYVVQVIQTVTMDEVQS